ncbi:RluA family pseudouridine synthase [uncultured Sanguibacteroides sp.]|uniref:RluA family pseudouridine synthase n=1 Tax=uncultured Sanguibacteroides sp. TaxID=1635151 RepID=UPI0025D217B3|nr:RluA family pseudouridine synthase [uncultured Sanguibacteroides sp.]
MNKTNNPRKHTPHKPQIRQFTVEEEAELLSYLFKQFPEKSRTTVKSILSNRQVNVNGQVTTQFNEPLKPGDYISINMEKGSVEFSSPHMDIVYEDSDLIIINKKSGLLSMATQNEKKKTAYHILSDYVKSCDPQNRIFIIHRLDRETSGLMMFAKNQQTQERMQQHWNEMLLERKYVAVIEGEPEKAEDQISTYLQENEAMNVYTSDRGKWSVTHYKVIKSNRRYSLVELELETGRKNQIRIHMAEIGHPVTGDSKYGAHGNPINRLALHARQLKFIHPSTGQVMNFRTDVPKRFSLLVKNRMSN